MVRPLVRRFDIEVGHCSQCGRRVQGRHPLQTTDALGAASVQLGPGGARLAVHLHTELGVPVAKVARLLRNAFGLHVTPGGLAHLLHRVARDAAPLYGLLCDQAQQFAGRSRRNQLASRRRPPLVVGVHHPGDDRLRHLPRPESSTTRPPCSDLAGDDINRDCFRSGRAASIAKPLKTWGSSRAGSRTVQTPGRLGWAPGGAVRRRMADWEASDSTAASAGPPTRLGAVRSRPWSRGRGRWPRSLPRWWRVVASLLDRRRVVVARLDRGGPVGAEPLGRHLSPPSLRGGHSSPGRMHEHDRFYRPCWSGESHARRDPCTRHRLQSTRLGTYSRPSVVSFE